MGKCISISRLCFIALSSVVLVSTSFAEIPAGYAGKPYKGQAQEIPGKVLWTYYDIGKDGVWKCDNTGESKVGGCSVGFRSDDGQSSHPGIYQTNTKNTFDDPKDFYVDGSVYPSKEEPTSSWYIGCSHATDWYCMTVHVQFKGSYWLSSTYAEEPGVSVAYTLSINGAEKAKINLGPTGGFHTWKTFPKFKSIDLDTGLWVLKCYLDNAHLNNDYILFETNVVEVLPGYRTSSPTAFSNLLTISPTSNENLKNVQYTISMPGQTSMSLYDCAGREVKSVMNANRGVGTYNQMLDMSNIMNGTYFVYLKNNALKSVTKINYVH
jgi:hypothetical protein